MASYDAKPRQSLLTSWHHMMPNRGKGLSKNCEISRVDSARAILVRFFWGSKPVQKRNSVKYSATVKGKHDMQSLYMKLHA